MLSRLQVLLLSAFVGLAAWVVVTSSENASQLAALSERVRDFIAEVRDRYHGVDENNQKVLEALTEREHTIDIHNKHVDDALEEYNRDIQEIKQQLQNFLGPAPGHK
jgi:TolA-binding protein